LKYFDLFDSGGGGVWFHHTIGSAFDMGSTEFGTSLFSACALCIVHSFRSAFFTDRDYIVGSFAFQKVGVAESDALVFHNELDEVFIGESALNLFYNFMFEGSNIIVEFSI
jgi:hypothetical protein